MTKKRIGLLRISDVAERAGVLASTIRHYTDLGLLPVVSTTDGGHRLYDEEDTLRQLLRIKKLATQGLKLPDIKVALRRRTWKILVIDDEPSVGDLVTDLLKGEKNFEVRVAYDGFSAGRVLSEYFPDLVILDLMLPGVDGFDVCRSIRQDSLLGGIKILAVTGYGTPENEKKIIEAGADGFLTKPIDVRELKECIGYLLSAQGKSTLGESDSAGGLLPLRENKNFFNDPRRGNNETE